MPNPLPPSTAPAVDNAKVAILLVDTEQRSRRFKQHSPQIPDDVRRSKFNLEKV
jgi:hypothetical protein